MRTNLTVNVHYKGFQIVITELVDGIGVVTGNHIEFVSIGRAQKIEYQTKMQHYEAIQDAKARVDSFLGDKPQHAKDEHVHGDACRHDAKPAVKSKGGALFGWGFFKS